MCGSVGVVGWRQWNGAVGGGSYKHASHSEGTRSNGSSVGNGEVKVRIEELVKCMWRGTGRCRMEGGARVDDRANRGARRRMASELSGCPAIDFAELIKFGKTVEPGHETDAGAVGGAEGSSGCVIDGGRSRRGHRRVWGCRTGNGGRGCLSSEECAGLGCHEGGVRGFHGIREVGWTNFP